MEKFVVDVDIEKYFEIIREYEDMMKTVDVLRSSYNRGFLTEKLKKYYEQYIGNDVEDKFNEIIEDLDVLCNSIYNSLYMFATVDSNLYDELNKIIDANFNSGDGITDEFVTENLSNVPTPPLGLIYNGQIVSNNSTIIMHPGETITFTVLLPPQYDDEDILLYRTTADGGRIINGADYNWTDYLKADSVVNGVPGLLKKEIIPGLSDDEIDLRAAQEKKVPASSYQWVVTAPLKRNGLPNLTSTFLPVASEGVKISQTAQFYVNGDIDNRLKAMITIYIKIIQ